MILNGEKMLIRHRLVPFNPSCLAQAEPLSEGNKLGNCYPKWKNGLAVYFGAFKQVCVCCCDGFLR
jgi:hypothetical protein